MMVAVSVLRSLSIPTQAGANLPCIELLGDLALPLLMPLLSIETDANLRHSNRLFDAWQPQGQATARQQNECIY